MSVWTQVFAAFRIDGYASKELDGEIDNIFGKECLYDSPIDVWEDYSKNPDKYLPCGSEGSLEKTIGIKQHPSYLDRYSIIVSGSLRDYDNTEAIKKWFCKVCENTRIRQATINIECYPESISLKYNPNEGIEELPYDSSISEIEEELYSSE